MALTRQQVEQLLVKRVGPAMVRADMISTANGENDDLDDPISWSLRENGYSVTSPLEPVDADIANVVEADYDQFLDLAEWRLVQNIIGNLDDTDERLGPSGQWASQFAKQMERYNARLESRLLKLYGWGLASLTTGTLRVVTLKEVDT